MVHLHGSESLDGPGDICVPEESGLYGPPELRGPRPEPARGFGARDREGGMSSVVFLRGVNVGGGRKFLPSALAKELSEFELVNLGAAGTFVAKSNVPDAKLRRAILDRLPFTTEVLVCPGREILDLLRSDPFGPLPPEAKACLTVLDGPSAHPPRLPIHVPDEAEWEAKIIAAQGRYVFGAYRRLRDRIVYPNPVVERAFAAHATTRGWATIQTVGTILSSA